MSYNMLMLQPLIWQFTSQFDHTFKGVINLKIGSKANIGKIVASVLL